ncbi:class I SAM-dependent methyltransferase [Litoribacter populi]|uniref:class I SAM-dependent methyltransferase n=1 Tax=Litoribacter populi TaxID=2598460 RepID=UPI00117DB1E2|nr:class I SAM-dependent methyltransferase [Litoribacter populi]
MIMNINVNYPYGWVGHIPFAFYLVRNFKPKLIVELGTHTGNSFTAFCEAVKMYNIGSKVFAIDTWSGDEHSGFYEDSVYLNLKSVIENHYIQIGEMIRKDFNDAVHDFNDKSIDCLHIDGLHTYEAVKNDFYTWLPKLKNEGLIIIHDTVVKREGFGVYKFWEDLIEIFPINYNFLHSNGLGVLSISKEKNSVSSKFVKGLIQSSDLINLMSWSGESLRQKHILQEENKRLKEIHERVLKSKPMVARKYIKLLIKKFRFGY